MKKILCLLSVATLIGCSSEKFGALTSHNITAEPKVMQVNGGEVNVTIKGSFPDNYFPKKGELVFIPTLVTPSGEIQGDEIIFYGQNAKDAGLLVVPRKTGGTFTETVTFPYTPNMKVAELYGVFVAKEGSKVVQLPRVKLADGIITTSLLVNVNEALPMMSAEALQGNITNTDAGTIHYQIQKAVIRNSQLKQPDMSTLISKLKEVSKNPKEKILAVNIISAASPDGTEQINKHLADQRSNAAMQYIQKEMTKMGIKVPVQTVEIDEDWDGLYKALAASNIKGKNEMIQAMRSETNGKKRQAILQKYIDGNKALEANLLPPLRRSTITITTEKIGMNNAAVMQQMQKNPATLSLNDWLYGTAMLPNEQQKIKSYEDIIKTYPNDWRAYNNLAAVYIKEDDINDAIPLLNKSVELQPSAQALFNMGLVEMNQNQVAAADSIFQVLPSSPGLNDAQGTADILSGNYTSAVQAFGNMATNNAMLAQIMANDYDKAANTFAAIKNPDATTYYLAAILGARTKNSNMVYNNLRQAVVLDRPLGESAKTDVEFARYWNSCQFGATMR
ncbi:MAG: tetratricopeptide repeat protein [Paludibacteraceae bacterium]